MRMRLCEDEVVYSMFSINIPRITIAIPIN